MPKLKEGFKGQRLISISPEILLSSQKSPLSKSLFITKIGFFPSVKYHYNRKDNGVDYYILIYCTSGEGWYKIADKTYTIKGNQYIVLPPNTPHVAYPIMPESDSRLQDRIQLFEEIYDNLVLSYHSDHYSYASLCLYHFFSLLQICRTISSGTQQR